MAGQTNSSGGSVSSSGKGMTGESQSVRDAYDAQQHQNGR